MNVCLSDGEIVTDMRLIRIISSDLVVEKQVGRFIPLVNQREGLSVSMELKGMLKAHGDLKAIWILLL